MTGDGESGAKPLQRPMAFRHFYPGDCEARIGEFLEQFEPRELPRAPLAVIVPHAGWRFSGRIAARALKTLAPSKPATLLMFSAVHRAWLDAPAVYPRGSWETPLGEVEVDEELAARLVENSGGLIVEDAAAHNDEHALEVVMPFLRELLPDVRVLPVMAPPDAAPVRLGQIAAEVAPASTIALASTDLTHYGDMYDFTPAGAGPGASAWMRANDQRLLDLAAAMRAEEIVPEARENHNACGPGALAAAISFARARGGVEGLLLERTDSHEVQGEKEPFQMAVGYAGMVF